MLYLGDNDKAIFGAGSDLQIYHDGSGSFIRDAGTGDLKIQATNLKLQDVDGVNYVNCIDGGYVRLAYAGATALETTSTGIDVTGTAVTDGLTVAGNVSVDGGTIKLDGNYPVGANNLGMGNNSLNGSLTGTANIAYGYSTLSSLTSGNYNVAVGGNSQASTTTGSNNVSSGFASLDANTSGGNNTALGHYALSANTTASPATQQLGISLLVFKSNTTGITFACLGEVWRLIQQHYRTAQCGDWACELYTLPQAGYNVSFGLGTGFTLQNNTTASNNTAVGYQSGYSNTTGTTITAIGQTSLYSNTTGNEQLAVGNAALYSNTTGGIPTALGLETCIASGTPPPATT